MLKDSLFLLQVHVPPGPRMTSVRCQRVIKPLNVVSPYFLRDALNDLSTVALEFKSQQITHHKNILNITTTIKQAKQILKQKHYIYQYKIPQTLHPAGGGLGVEVTGTPSLFTFHHLPQ